MENKNVLTQIFKNENEAKTIFTVFVLLYFLSDIITKTLLVYSVISFNRIAGIVKLCFELVMLVYLFKKGKVNKSLCLGLILLFAFIISQTYYIIININNIDFNTVIKNVYYANRYLYIFIFIAFIKLYDISFSRKDNFIKLFKAVLYINSVLIIIGVLFEIELFRSYTFSSRFGYDGIFSKHGEAAYYYIFFILILYNEYLFNKSRQKFLMLLAVSMTSILLGKKAIFLFLFLLILIHSIFYLKRIKEISVLVLMSMVFIVFFKEPLLELFFKLTPYWSKVYDDVGFMGALTSHRSSMLVEFFNYVQHNWKFFDFVFGIGEYEKHKVEFEFIDVFMFFGLTGIFVFSYFLKKYFYSKNNTLSKCLLLSVLTTSFFSGALFISVTGMMFFYVIFQWINSSEYA